jgi:hypothetical protein
MWIYLLYIIKGVLYSNSYVQNILQTDGVYYHMYNIWTK